MAAYYGVIHKEEGTDYGLSFPDLPGCITSGSTLEELSVMASEALKLHLEGMEEDKDSLPIPRSHKEVLADVQEEDGFYGLTLGSVYTRVRKVRVNISIPETDLVLIDVAAAREEVDRSGFLVRAAKKVALGECTF